MRMCSRAWLLVCGCALQGVKQKNELALRVLDSLVASRPQQHRATLEQLAALSPRDNSQVGPRTLNPKPSYYSDVPFSGRAHRLTVLYSLAV